jgi:phage repressor protein C with HTH and peptisase S24 domain
MFDRPKVPLDDGAERKAQLDLTSSETLGAGVKLHFHNAAMANRGFHDFIAPKLPTVGARIQWARKQVQKSQSALAGQFKVSVQAVSQWENDRITVPYERLEQLSAFLGVPVSWLRTGEIEPGAIYPTAAPGAPSGVAEPNARAGGLAGEVTAPPSFTLLDRDVPVYGTAVCGESGDFEMNGQIVDFVRRPPGLAGASGAFAIYPLGDSMWPRYEEGEPVFVHPGRPVRPGRDVLVELQSVGEGVPMVALLKRLVTKNSSFIDLQQFNPPFKKPLRIPMDRVKSVFPA